MTNALVGLKLLTGFFAFGALMCALTTLLLLFPGTAFDAVWRVNPEAQTSFQELGQWAILLMAMVGIACALAAIGLARQTRWGWWLALAVLGVNLLGDTTSALVRRDWRTLIGLPIGGAMIFYLWKIRARLTR